MVIFMLWIVFNPLEQIESNKKVCENNFLLM